MPGGRGEGYRGQKETRDARLESMLGESRFRLCQTKDGF